MPIPEDLLKIAALGTEQRPGKLPIGHATLEDMVAHLGGARPEAQLLIQAAVINLREQAGYQPHHNTVDMLPAAPTDHTIPCSGRAVRHLMLMLEGVHPNLLPVWLHEVTETSQRVPEEMLPLLLTYGSDRAYLREQLLPVIGQRGRWLAGLAESENWRWVFDTELEKGWYVNSADAWVDYFKRLRKRDPDTARELLAEYWTKIESRMKYSMLNAMKTGLSYRDEDFLLARLEDDWTTMPAARMLCSIGDSDFGKKMRRSTERMLLIMQMGRQRRWVIDFVWSSAFEQHPAHTARAYASKLTRAFQGKWTPEQMLSFVPLAYWYERWDVTPAILVEGARNSTNPYAILEAWTQIAIFEEDNEFALELLRQENPNRLNNAGRVLLIKLLNAEQVEDIGIFWLDRIKQGISDRHPAIPLLDSHKQRWSDDMMMAFLASLERGFTETARPLLVRSIRSLLMNVVPYFSLEMIDEVKRVLKLNKRPELSESEMEVIDGIVAVLEFQQEMIRAIRNREE